MRDCCISNVLHELLKASCVLLLILWLKLNLCFLLFCLTQGLSLLEVKDQLLLMYLMDLSHLILDKASGGSLQGHAAVLRLVEIRTV
jgi:hypothetical protein